jgi:hypothetical protein
MLQNRETNLDGRERRRLQIARENAYLDARRPDSHRVIKAYGLWCWRLRIPMVWYDRLTPHSRYGRVHLDMLTTSRALTDAGQGSVGALAAVSGARERARVSPHDACLKRIPLAGLKKLAHEVFRAATAAGNCAQYQSRPAEAGSERPLKVVELPLRKAASA